MLNKPKTFIAFYGDYDPTKTLTLRNQFAAQMAKRFRALRGLIRKAIVEQDCFGLNVPEFPDFQFNEMQAPGRRAFNFRTSGEKVQGFMDWLHIQVKEGILEIKEYTQVGKGVEEAWTNMYVQSGYQKGIFKARGELTKAGHPVPSIDETGGLELAFNQPFHLDRVGLLYARTFNDLKGITDAMEGQISRVLAQGMADGKNPMEIAKLLTKTISGPIGDLGITDTLGRFMPAERRAKILARTEIIRAHHAATIQEYKNWGVVGVTVDAEWETAGDGRVCPLCAPLQGRIFKLEEIESMIPRHPQCRCCALPVKVDEAGDTIEEGVEEENVKWKDAGDIDTLQKNLEKLGIEYFSGDIDEHVLVWGNKIGEELQHMHNTKPKLSKILKNKTDQVDVYIYNKSVLPSPKHTENVVGLYDKFEQSIGIAGNNTSANMLKLGHFNAVTGVQGSTRHELGHYIHLNKLPKAATDEWTILTASKNNKWIEENISKYAATNERETFAEAFGYWTHPNYAISKKLPEEIETYFKKWLE